MRFYSMSGRILRERAGLLPGIGEGRQGHHRHNRMARVGSWVAWVAPWTKHGRAANRATARAAFRERLSGHAFERPPAASPESADG